MMWKRMLPCLLGLTLAGMALPAMVQAVNCRQHVEDTEHNLTAVKAELVEVEEKNKPRILLIIGDAEKLLATARTDCERAGSSLDRALAAAKALIAQGNVAAARLLIKVR